MSIVSAFLKQDKADFSWYKAADETLAEMTGARKNRWGEHMRDESGNLMYEKNEAGELVPKIAGLSDYKNLSKSMEGYDAILKQFSASEMRGNPIALLHLFNQAVLGRRFKTDPTGKTTIHQTDKGIQQSIERIPEAIKESFEDLMDFVNQKYYLWD